jgi:hypothetical protein
VEDFYFQRKSNSGSYGDATSYQTARVEQPSYAQFEPTSDAPQGESNTEQESRGRSVQVLGYSITVSSTKIHGRTRPSWGVGLNQRDSKHSKYFDEALRAGSFESCYFYNKFYCVFLPDAGGDINTEARAVHTKMYVEKNYYPRLEAVSSRLAAAMASVGTLGISAITYAVSVSD